jgi:hypothetical protein
MKTYKVSARGLGAVFCLLVILSLVTAEFTWLTQPVHAEAGWPPWKSAHLRLSARIVGHRLLIAGSGFPQRHFLAVRARKYDGDPWYNLDMVKSSRKGKFSADLPLPHRLENANSLRVCVKDTTSGRLSCVTARRY